MASRSEFAPTPQLKNTCDACNSAKVKCSQARPKCGRCESRGLYCQYSISLRSAKHRYPSSSNKNVNTSKGRSPEAYDDASMHPPAVSSAANASMLAPYDPIMPSLEDTGFLSPLIGGWNTDFQGSGSQTPFSDVGDDSMMVLPQFISANHKLPHQKQPSRSSRARRTATYPADDDSLSPTSSITPSSSACSCQKSILAKLSELSDSSRVGPSVPFDRSLSENKSIITLCTCTVSCPNRHHDQDIILMLTTIALITHAISIYDQPLRVRSQDGGGDLGAVGLALSDASSPELIHSGCSTSSRERRQHQQPQPMTRVRLSLGSYQLDQKDEQILQTNLLRIELSKIGGLVDSFEKRFCSLDYGWSTGSRHEPQPIGEAITYLKKRLRASYEALNTTM